MSLNYGWGKQGHAPCEIPLCHKATLVELHGGRKTAYKCGVKSGHPQFWGYRISNSGVCLSTEG